MTRSAARPIDPDRSKRLADFVAYARSLRGDEKGEAQVFIDRLFRAFGHGGYKEAGATLEQRVRKTGGGTAFADLIWKPIVLIEMKKRGEDLAKHLTQAFDYWVQAVPGRPRYVVLCNFDEFRIYDFDKDINEPQDTVGIDELPERYGPLNFLFPTREEPLFRVDREKVTRHAADLLATVYKNISKAPEVGPAKAQRFVLQCLICLFSEDIGLLPKHFFTQLLDECTDPPRAFDLLDGLFRAMNAKSGTGAGRFKPVPYFNGGIFSESAAVELEPGEVHLLKAAATYNWSHISPDIFGTIFQHSMNEKERHAFGAHYTSPADIMKIVGPTIVEPWRTAIAEARSVERLRALQQRLYTFRVLDPACGSGNFLYIAYRELKRVEKMLHDRLREVAPSRAAGGQREFGFVTSKQFYGMDVLPFAVELAKVTMTLAHKLSIDELHVDEAALPLDNLDANIVCCDALIAPKGRAKWPAALPQPPYDDVERTEWPPADAIIGNPPFLGAKRLKPERGADYVNAVRHLYPEVPGMADYCVYWIRRTHDHLKPCTAADPFTGRAGLVGTQNIRNNQSRVGGLDHVVKTGVIVEAVETQPWSGEANVHVSIANWVKTGALPSCMEHTSASHSPAPTSSLRRLWTRVDTAPSLSADFEKHNPTAKAPKSAHKDKLAELAPRAVRQISSALSDAAVVSRASPLACNTSPQVSFQGVVPGYDGFALSYDEARQILSDWPTAADVIRPWLTGRELLSGDGTPNRCIIDFGDMPMEAAAKHAPVFDLLRQRVLPAVQDTARRAADNMREARAEHLQRWWQYWNVRSEMRQALKNKRRYIACSRVTKRPVFAFVSTNIVPDGALQVWSLDDDYSFGVIHSDAHWQWFFANCSKLKSDFRYTRRSVWDTFPWPQTPTTRDVERIAQCARELRRLRSELLSTSDTGLRGLYRLLELPGRHPLKDAHQALNRAVLQAYGLEVHRPLVDQLLELNATLASRIAADMPVTAPGIPPSIGPIDTLVTDDCITPTPIV